jgi:hypothetical protein
LLNIGDRIWDQSAQLRARLETDFNIKLNTEDAYQTWKAASPEFTDQLELLTTKRWGITLIPTKSGWTVIKSKAAPPFGLPPWLAKITFGWFLMNVALFVDNTEETFIIHDLVSHGWSHDDAAKEANYLSFQEQMLFSAESGDPGLISGMAMFQIFEDIQEKDANRYKDWADRIRTLQGYKYNPPYDTLGSIEGFPCITPSRLEGGPCNDSPKSKPTDVVSCDVGDPNCQERGWITDSTGHLVPVCLKCPGAVPIN